MDCKNIACQVALSPYDRVWKLAFRKEAFWARYAAAEQRRPPDSRSGLPQTPRDALRAGHKDRLSRPGPRRAGSCYRTRSVSTTRPHHQSSRHYDRGPRRLMNQWRQPQREAWAQNIWDRLQGQALDVCDPVRPPTGPPQSICPEPLGDPARRLSREGVPPQAG